MKKRLEEGECVAKKMIKRLEKEYVRIHLRFKKDNTKGGKMRFVCLLVSPTEVVKQRVSHKCESETISKVLGIESSSLIKSRNDRC